jgi:hypothetical protein
MRAGLSFLVFAAGAGLRKLSDVPILWITMPCAKPFCLECGRLLAPEV